MRPARFKLMVVAGGVSAALIGMVVLWQLTEAALQPVPHNLDGVLKSVVRARVTDRYGTVLNSTYINQWNLHDIVALHEIPPFLTNAFVLAEDKRFFDHSGPDWAARFSALGGNIAAMRGVRGASTITEQVVRMIHPRPRTLWARWLEGWEAGQMEQTQSKADILEFYLNQVPYAANRRGVAQASRYYFDRDLDTLGKREMLALAVLARAPSRLDLYAGNAALLQGAITRLASRMTEAGQLSTTELERTGSGTFDLERPVLPVEARHFLRYVSLHRFSGGTKMRTTLDGALQAQLQLLLDRRLQSLSGSRVANAAMLVADHSSGEVLAWVVGGAGNDDVPGNRFDAVTTPRQPGSAMKPFLYALALEKGWTAATLLDDTPLMEMVGSGLHSYKNYSRTFHGPVTLRNALGNSLNIPAVRTIQFVGTAEYLALLDRLGFESLARAPYHYGDGLALGNGEITLLELVRAYGALANRGVYRPLAVLPADVGAQPGKRIFSAETASLVGHILSDPGARSLEFGSGGLLDLPLQTAVKTGTSSDFRDSWAVGYNDRYVAGVWMGNLNQRPTLGVTGATGPTLVLRGAFDILNSHRQTAALWLSPRLQRHVVCAGTGNAYRDGMHCPRRSEFFLPGTSPAAPSQPGPLQQQEREIHLRQPTPGLHLAYDPRLPQAQQAFEFVLQGVRAEDIVDWRIDGGEVMRRKGARYLWPVSRGEHSVAAVIRRNERPVGEITETRFLVR